MAVTDTGQEAPQKLESSIVLDTAMRIGWRYKGTLFLLVLCLTAVFAALSCGFGLLLPSSFHPNGELNPRALVKIALYATEIFVPMLLQAVLVDVYVADLEGRRPAPGSCLRSAAGAAIPALAIGIVIFLAVTIAGLFFIIPGIMLAVALFVAIPAQRRDGGGVNVSINRSLELTQGRRWQVFSLVFNLALLSGIAYGLLMVLLLVGTQLAVKFPDFALTILVAQALGLALALPFVWLLWGFGHAIAYIELRRISEGPDFLAPNGHSPPPPCPPPIRS
ncbi:MAG: hypothetical protein FWD68_17780 [Alphaproteobacteria bacterium]|nr:hypothetical protein [Alphaproteobacteria bacterium]